MSALTSLLTVTPTSRFCIEKIPQSCGLVIFGASGDLTYRKLLPSIIHLQTLKLLPKNFFVIGVSRTPFTDESFREKIKQSIVAVPISDQILSRFYYHAGEYENKDSYQALQQKLLTLDQQYQTNRRWIFYLATPPELYPDIIMQLSSAGLVSRKNTKESWTHVIIEKPFGHDLQSAKKLNQEICKSLSENQIYRIDHYLGKETVQNILLFRFANSIFEPVWSRDYIDHIQITAAETIGVEHRAGYYAQAGALRDMFQNHILQLVALTAMEQPKNMEAESVRNERVKVIKSLRPIAARQVDQMVIRAQYGNGKIDGKTVAAYSDEEGIRKDSLTETFVAAKFLIDNKRWQGVPFYCRSGKRLSRKITEIAIQFKHVPKFLFEPSIKREDVAANVLSFRIQPHEGISISFQAKQPGPKFCMNSLTLDFNYKEAFGVEPPEAYERLLLDCMLGDQTLFTRQDDVELSWTFLAPILDQWAKEVPKNFPSYQAGSWGPAEADQLIQKDSRAWRNLV